MQEIEGKEEWRGEGREKGIERKRRGEGWKKWRGRGRKSQERQGEMPWIIQTSNTKFRLSMVA